MVSTSTWPEKFQQMLEFESSGSQENARTTDVSLIAHQVMQGTCFVHYNLYSRGQVFSKELQDFNEKRVETQSPTQALCAQWIVN